MQRRRSWTAFSLLSRLPARKGRVNLHVGRPDDEEEVDDDREGAGMYAEWCIKPDGFHPYSVFGRARSINIQLHRDRIALSILFPFSHSPPPPSLPPLAFGTQKVGDRDRREKGGRRWSADASNCV